MLRALLVPITTLALVGNAGNAGSQIAVGAGRQLAVRGTDIRQGPVYTTDRVVFQLNNMTAAQAIQMPVRLRVDNPSPSAPFATVAPPHSCVTMTPTTHMCDGPLPQETVNQLNQPGRRELYAFAFDGNCCESAASGVYTIQGRRP